MPKARYKFNVTDEMRALAFEYYISQGRVLPIPSPKLRVASNGGLEVLIPPTDDGEEIWLPAGTPAGYSPHDLVQALASGTHAYGYVLKSRSGGDSFSLILSCAATADEAERQADLKLVEKFVVEVGRQRAAELLLRWTEEGPGFLSIPKKVGRNDPCPCGSGFKYKKCCGRYA